MFNKEDFINVIHDKARKAEKLDLYYVVCFWKSPVNNQMNYRTGYFEDATEAEIFRDGLKSKYKDKFSFPFYIVSNTVVGTISGGFEKYLI